MNSIVCTLFEDHYHHGVACLTNSLYCQGFRGSVFAGYRGALPNWASGAKENVALSWPGAITLDVEEALSLHFLPLDTNFHLTNYKPDFMLRLLEGPAKDAGAIFYFDPDIVISAPWDYIKDWSNCGISLCEDVNSPLSRNNPRRVAWRNYFGERGFSLHFKDSIYANGGFVGISKANRAFLELWKSLQIAMAARLGGLHLSAINGAKLSKEEQGPFAPFSKTDQDALNAAVEAWSGEISFIGKEGMGFNGFEAVMPHALGDLKPWNYKPLAKALDGIAPRQVDREYWKFSKGPIIAHSSFLIRRKLIAINLASFISRFYCRISN